MATLTAMIFDFDGVIADTEPLHFAGFRQTLAEIVRQAVDAYLTDRSVDPATALNSTFGALPNLEVPSRDEWDHA